MSSGIAVIARTKIKTSLSMPIASILVLQGRLLVGRPEFSICYHSHCTHSARFSMSSSVASGSFSGCGSMGPAASQSAVMQGGLKRKFASSASRVAPRNVRICAPAECVGADAMARIAAVCVKKLATLGYARRELTDLQRWAAGRPDNARAEESTTTEFDSAATCACDDADRKN